MDQATPSPESPLVAADLDRAPKQRRCTADYRWTQPKVTAFLEALSRCGRVAEAGRAAGMSGTSAYRLRARMGSPRFDATFEGARRSGIRARAAASRAKAQRVRSRWEGLGIAELAARERAFAQAQAMGAQGDALASQGDALTSQSDYRLAQGYARPPQGAGLPPQGAGFSHKVTEFVPGPCNTRSMSRPAELRSALAHGPRPTPKERDGP